MGKKRNIAPKKREKKVKNVKIVMLTRSERQLKARGKTIEARSQRIAELQTSNAELVGDNERLREERKAVDERIKVMERDHREIIDDLREEQDLVKEQFKRQADALREEKKNEKVLATLKTEQLQRQSQQYETQIRKLTADNKQLTVKLTTQEDRTKENMAPPLLPPPPPQLSTSPTCATQLSQAKYDHFHQTSNDNFRQRHTFKDQKRRHKLAKMYGSRLATLEQRRHGATMTIPITQWNAPQLAEFVACLPDEAVNRIGAIFFVGYFVTYAASRCPVETVVLSDKQQLVVEFRRQAQTVGLTMTVRRMRGGECVENQNGQKVHFGGQRQRPY